MWTEEDEEKYIDLLNIYDLLEPKRTVKGDLINDTYIEEKKIVFEKKSFFDGDIYIYLPEGRSEKHYGEKFLYFVNMGEYEEYISLDNNFIFTIEKCENKSFNVEITNNNQLMRVYESFKEELEKKYKDTIVGYWCNFEISEYNYMVYVAEVHSYVDEEEVIALIYFLFNEEKCYRFYIGTREKNLELVDALGQKIVGKILFHNNI